VLCAIAGDSVGYEVGRLAGPALRRSRLGRRIGEERWQRAEEFLRRHGGKAVLLGRCTALLRALVPGLAGMSRMRYRTFLVWNAAGGIVWGAGCVLLGYAFAQSLTLLDRYLHYASTTVLVLAIGGLVAHRLLVRRRRRAEEAREVQHTASGTSL
jgi:membrane protein DedA with SNARE-associated domain